MAPQADKPAARELDSAAVNQLASILSALSLLDVAPAQAVAAPADAQLLKTQLITADGINIGIKDWAQDGKNWLQLAASLDTLKASAYLAAAQAKTKAAAATQAPAASPDKPLADSGKQAATAPHTAKESQQHLVKLQ